jgi:hypothetical protein
MAANDEDSRMIVGDGEEEFNLDWCKDDDGE